jgi:hypothetical protein
MHPLGGHLLLPLEIGKLSLAAPLHIYAWFITESAGRGRIAIRCEHSRLALNKLRRCALWLQDERFRMGRQPSSEFKRKGTGDVVVLGEDAIHAIANPLNRTSCAIHVYGGDLLNFSGRSLRNPFPSPSRSTPTMSNCSWTMLASSWIEAQS